jgi:hypothetical protein
MQTDVVSSVPLTVSGQFASQNSLGDVQSCRVKAIYIVPSGTAGSVVLTDGGSSGSTRMTVNTVASATQPTYLILPGEGVLFRTNVYGTLTNVGSATIFYG